MFNTKWPAGELEAVMLMQKAPKNEQLGHAVSITDVFQARMLIDSGRVTEGDAEATLYHVANLVNQVPYEKSRY